MKKPNPLRPDIFRAAAELVEKCPYPFEHYVSCAAITYNVLQNYSHRPNEAYDIANEYKDAYAEYFKPEDKETGERWFGSTHEQRNQLPRQLALEFMALIVEDAK